jgi:hypothetical protein
MAADGSSTDTTSATKLPLRLLRANIYERL